MGTFLIVWMSLITPTIHTSTMQMIPVPGGPTECEALADKIRKSGGWKTTTFDSNTREPTHPKMHFEPNVISTKCVTTRTRG